MTMILMGDPSLYSPLIGDPQIQRPLVHGFTVGPTPNPFYLLSIILFIKKDFPVLYIPTTEMTPIGPGIAFMISKASLFMA